MKRFNAILDTLPDDWQGVIKNTDFKVVLRFFRVLSMDWTEERKALEILNLFFDGTPPEIPDLWEQIELFISCGEKREEDEGRETKAFCFNVDHGRIFAAFLSTYGIDLRTAKLHWWIFSELLSALPDNTKLMQIIELRQRKPSKNDSPEYKKELRKMKERVKIDENTVKAIETALDRW